MDLKFRYNGGSSDLTFLDESMVGSNDFKFFNVTFKNGNIRPCEGPEIIEQPESGIQSTDSCVTYTVNATGTKPLSYQWYKNNEQLAINNEQFTGVNDSILTINIVSTTVTGRYKCVLSNICGSVTSDTVTLIVHTPVLITIQPQTDTVCTTDNVTFSVSAIGTEPIVIPMV